MKEIQNDSVQNRFTAYLMAAVTHKRNRYFAQRRRLQEQECPEVDLLERLKEKEKRILFARILGEQSFVELEEWLHLEPKQAELAYYYIIRKLRKELEGWKDEF